MLSLKTVKKKKEFINNQTYFILIKRMFINYYLHLIKKYFHISKKNNTCCYLNENLICES